MLRFKNLYYAVAISFLCSLFYWVWSFAQKEAERQAFTPQMRHTLLALAGAVHVTRRNLDKPLAQALQSLALLRAIQTDKASPSRH